MYTLVILAAGLGSRYGGIKQIAQAGPNGEILMDYALHDAKQAGFEKVVFVLKEELVEDFKNTVGKRAQRHMEVAYAVQSFASLPDWYQLPAGRIKPFGTVPAVLSAKDVVDGPFAVINADDYYGKKGFVSMKNALQELNRAGEEKCAAIVTYLLKNTVSRHGAVNRGVCQVEGGMLRRVKETYEIAPDENDILKDKDGQVLDGMSPVSMNFWGFLPSFFRVAEENFHAFLKELTPEQIKAECLLPALVDELMAQQGWQVYATPCEDAWFGMTYQQDLPAVRQALKEKHDAGEYPPSLM